MDRKKKKEVEKREGLGTKKTNPTMVEEKNSCKELL